MVSLASTSLLNHGIDGVLVLHVKVLGRLVAADTRAVEQEANRLRVSTNLFAVG